MIVSIPEDLRQFVDQRSLEGGFDTPNEYVRSLIHEDRRRAEREQYGPLLSKWLTQGQLSPEEEALLPQGLLGRAQRNMERLLLAGVASGDAGELTRERLEIIAGRARAKVSLAAENGP